MSMNPSWGSDVRAIEMNGFSGSVSAILSMRTGKILRPQPWGYSDIEVTILIETNQMSLCQRSIAAQRGETDSRGDGDMLY